MHLTYAGSLVVPLGNPQSFDRGGTAHYGLLVCHAGEEIDRLFGRAAVAATGHSLIAAGPASLLLEGEVGPARRRCGVPPLPPRGNGTIASFQPCADLEASLAFAALADLLRGVLDEGLSTLPPPQAAALRVAVLLQEPEGSPPDPFAVAVATLGLVRGLAAQWLVLIALDDYAWLDTASANVLAFVLRRLEAEPVGDSERSGARTDGLPVTLLDEATTGRPLVRMLVGPLSCDAIYALLANEVPSAVRRRASSEIAETSGGNPLFAIEIRRSIERGKIVDQPGRPLTVPARCAIHRAPAQPARTPIEEGCRRVAVSDPTVELLDAVTAAMT